MTKNSTRYPANDRELATAITEAIAAVKGKDPMELDPLYETVDPDALKRAINSMDSGSVSFPMDGVEITVTNTRDIIIEDKENTAQLDELTEEASNVLLLTPPHDRHDDEACKNFVSQRSAEETNLLGITYAQNAYDRLELWEEHNGDYPANTTVVDVGTHTRSATSDTIGTIDSLLDPYTIRTVADETDLTGVGKVVIEELADWKNNEKQTVACFHSVTDLLEHMSEDQAFRFLHTLSSKLESEGVTAHYHMNPAAHDEKTIRLFSELFNAVVEVSESGFWNVDRGEKA